MKQGKREPERQWEEMLVDNARQLKLAPDSPDLLVRRAMLLMADDRATDYSTSPFQDAEQRILRALELNPMHLSALEEAAHVYDVVVPDRQKSKTYARRYIEIAGKTLVEMQAIIGVDN